MLRAHEIEQDPDDEDDEFEDDDFDDEDDDDEEEAVLDAVLVEDDVAVDVVEGAQAIAATGVSRLVVVPSPSCPWALLPQQ